MERVFLVFTVTGIEYMDVSSQRNTSIFRRPRAILKEAIEQHQGGRLNHARHLYLQFTKESPTDSKGWYLLGCLCHQMKENKSAETYLRKAIQVHPGREVYHHNLATILQSQERLDEAISSFKDALTIDPEYPQALHGLGTVYSAQGRFEKALECYERVLDARPDHIGARINKGFLYYDHQRYMEAASCYQEVALKDPDTPTIHLYLANAYRKMGHFIKAIRYYQMHLRLETDSWEGISNLGESYLELGRSREALACYRKLVKKNPKSDQAWNNMGICQQAIRDRKSAQESYLKAIRLNPEEGRYYNNLGKLFLETNAHEQALYCFEAALNRKKDYSEALVNLGVVHLENLNHGAALRCIQQVLRMRPGNQYALWHRSLLRLRLGHLLRGFKDYEIRTQSEFLSLRQRHFRQPLWDGKLDPRRILLVHTEQGFGDSIQFSRFLPQVKSRVGKLYLECHESLERVFRQFLPPDQIFSPGETLPVFDSHCPLPSLAHIFLTEISSIPTPEGYLKAQGSPKKELRELLQVDSYPLLRVGIVWAGNPNHRNDIRRSCAIEHFLGLLGVPGTRIYSLQVEEKPNRLKTILNYPITDLSPVLHDFADTAQAISQLDLLISVDTSVAHLAGALGCPTWLLLPYSPDWRWLLNRRDSPWYRSFQIFRQNLPGDWGELFYRVQKAFVSWSRSKTAIQGRLRLPQGSGHQVDQNST
jgi:tetratricopeptide (TPR) repeat protein